MLAPLCSSYVFLRVLTNAVEAPLGFGSWAESVQPAISPGDNAGTRGHHFPQQFPTPATYRKIVCPPYVICGASCRVPFNCERVAELLHSLNGEIAMELLDPTVPRVCNKHVPPWIHRDGFWGLELSIGSGPSAAPPAKKSALRVKHLNPTLAVDN